ncbi:MAG TPA: universal stress protein [Phenylobacterium sp.]|jgi:nucleotide-binding universal stress UspA family protein|nr:universal stress protein [Phenylobacterium sp.]
MTTLVQDAPVRNRFRPAQGAWRSILTHVQPETDAQPRLAVAVDLARKLDATLIGLGAEMLPPLGASDPYGMLGGEFVSAMLDVIQTNLVHAQAGFQKAAAGVRGQWMSVQDLPERAISRLSRGADLIVAGGSPLKAHDSYRWCDPGQLILNSGRPVLVAPPAGGTLGAEAVVVAWKDSREARRALADALPILKCAEDVLLVEICAKEDVEDTAPHHASVLEHLERHGIKARSKIVPGHPTVAADTLQFQAKSLGADLIVSGGYGHSRLGEWVMGGVTADLLADPQRFVLFSH